MRVETLGPCTLYLADSRDIIPTLGGVDVVITDPPYGVNYNGSATKHSRDVGGYASFEDTPGNIETAIVPIVTQCIERFGRLCMTPGRSCMFLYPAPRCVGAIHYPSGANYGPWGFICSQPIFYYGADPYLSNGLGGRPDGFSTTESAEKNGHPCPKPIGQMKWLVNRASLADDLVLDPFMGSGTTGVACVELGRRFVGIEFEPVYFEIALSRIEQALRQPRLFDTPHQKPKHVGSLFGEAA